MEQQWLKSAIELLTEIYEGPQQEGTWIVDTEKNSGILGTLGAVSAEQASAHPINGKSSIAGHASHLRFGLSLANAYARGEQPEHAWEASWKTQMVTEGEWTRLQAEIRREYDEWRGHLSRFSSQDPEFLTGALASVSHSAYHLGALRQLISAV